MTHTQHAYLHMEKDWCLESLSQLNFQRCSSYTKLYTPTSWIIFKIPLTISVHGFEARSNQFLAKPLRPSLDLAVGLWTEWHQNCSFPTNSYEDYTTQYNTVMKNGNPKGPKSNYTYYIFVRIQPWLVLDSLLKGIQNPPSIANLLT